MALNWPLEQQGSTGENVRSIQYLLNARSSVSAGAESEGTESASEVSSGRRTIFDRRSVQASEAQAADAAIATSEFLTVDGIFGPKTEALVRVFQTGHGLTADGKVGNQTWPELIIDVATGNIGDAVRAVQSQIRTRSGWLTVDGIFGQQTDNVVRSFQSFCNLSIDGIVGPNTWNALTLAFLRASSGSAAADLVYQAWTKNDRASAAYEAIPLAVDQLFARTWQESDGWTSGGCGAAAGSFVCEWKRTGETLILEGNDSAGAPFYYVNNATFQA
jgi:peptidoglycan hydrolase-like protein with peptidoglycan-binding domain